MSYSLPEPSDAVAVGWILGPHGTAGQVRVRIHSDDPQRFDPGQTLYCNDEPLVVTAASTPTRNRVILRLEGIDTHEAARLLGGLWLTVPLEDVADLPDGEYFHFQLLGLRVVTVEGEELGDITEIIETGSNDVYVVDGPGGQVLIPAIASVVQEVRLDRGTMLVRLIDGLR